MRENPTPTHGPDRAVAASGRYAKTVARTLSRLCRFASDPRHNPTPRAIENIEVSVHDKTLRLVAADGWVMAVLDITLEQPPGQNGARRTLIKSADIAAVAKDLAKGPPHTPVLSLQAKDELISLISERGGVAAPPTIQTDFPNWRKVMPPIATNEEFERFAIKPPHMSEAAGLAAAMDAQMRFTCATASGVARIDCVSSIPGDPASRCAPSSR